MVLFMVETSFSGVLRIGRQPHVTPCSSARPRAASGARPVKWTMSSTSRSWRQLLELLEAVAGADEGERDVVAAEAVLHVGRGPDGVVDAVLGTHHADVDGEEAGRPGGARARAAPRRRRSGSGPVRTIVMSSACFLPRRMAARRYDSLVDDHVAGRAVGRPLEREQEPVRQARRRRGTATRTARGTGRAGRTRTGTPTGWNSRPMRPEDVGRVAGLDGRRCRGAATPSA